METLSGNPATKSIASAGSAKMPVKSSSIQEPVRAMGAGEGSPDAFWLILRELRVIGEKLDVLISGTEHGGFKKNSDKSYH
jgi:hypothetical protein